MVVRLPVSMISSSTCLVTLATTSSMRAGWMRPSCTSWWSERRAISRRTGSKAERVIASGVSSTTISTPVAASNARILRPSRPMMRPLTSSLSIWNTVTAFSTVVSDAMRWIDCIMIFLASLFAVNLASSIVSLIYAIAAVLASSRMASINCFFASSAERPDICSSCWAAFCCRRSISCVLCSTAFCWFSSCWRCWFNSFCLLMFFS